MKREEVWKKVGLGKKKESLRFFFFPGGLVLSKN